MVFMFGIGILTILGLSIMKQKNIFIIYLLVAFGLAVVVYRYDPIDGNDLHSYFWELGIMKDLSWTETLAREHWKAYPVAKLYLYNIAKLNDVHMLPAITVFVTCILFSATLRKYCKRFQLSKKNEIIAYTYFLCCFNFFYLASNIRNLLAVAVFVYFLYIDIVVNKKKLKLLCFAVYIMTIFIHSSMIVFIILRVVIFIKNRRLMFLALMICLMYTAFQEKIFTLLNETFNYEFVNSLVERATESANSKYRAVLESMRCLMIIIFQIAVLFMGYKNSEKSIGRKMFYRYTLIMCIFTLCSFSDYWLFMRLTLASELFFPIALAGENNYLSKRSKAVNVVTYIICLINVIYMFHFQYSYF